MMKGAFWTEESDTTLRAMHAAGHRYTDIGARLGVSKDAIAGRAQRIGLAKRAPPLLTTYEKAERKRTKHRRRSEQRKKERRLGSAETSLSVKTFQPRPPRIADVEPLHITLYDLERFQCRWAYGESLNYTFCGYPQQPESSYCPAHHALSVDKVRSERRPSLGILKRAA